MGHYEYTLYPPSTPAVRWQPVFAGTCYWRVFRGTRQLGHVARRVGPGYLASHIEPGGRRLERPFATLREAAWWAIFGCTEVTK